MKIAMISSGNSIHVKKLANALTERGHLITLYTLPNHDKLLSDLDERIIVKKLPVKGKLGYYLNSYFIKRDLAKNPADLVNAHYASGYGTLARRVNFHPLALAVFGADVYEYPFSSKANMRTVLKNLDCADVITSTSHVMADKVREFYPRDRKIFITPFGVDLDVFHPVITEKEPGFEIGIVKKIEKKYGIEYLLGAFKELRDHYGIKDARLVIYGRGSALEEYKQMAAGLGDAVEFKGFIRNELVPEALSHMDVACFPSVEDSESFGVAAVEAMACGVPVVASDASGFTEVIEDGVTGFLVPRKNEKALAESIYKICQMSPEDRKKMGAEGIKRVRKYYDFKDNVDAYEEALRMALEGKKV